MDYRKRDNQKEDAHVFVGAAASAILETMLPEDQAAFYGSVRQYYMSACDYMVARFPFRDPVLIHARAADTTQTASSSWQDILFFIKKFPCLVLKLDEEDICQATDQLQEQFNNFQAEELPQAVCCLDREDQKWAHLAKQRQLGDLAYNRLAHCMLGILSLPHSNASCERLFSQVRKNKTDFRGSLSSSMLNNMMVAKANLRGSCYEQKFSQDFLKKAKSLTAQMVKKN